MRDVFGSLGHLSSKVIEWASFFYLSSLRTVCNGDPFTNNSAHCEAASFRDNVRSAMTTIIFA